MSIQLGNNPQTNHKANQQKDAEAWLNIRIRDVEGNAHNIRAYIPLHSDNNIHAALITQAKAIKEFEVTTGVKANPVIIEGSVNLVSPTAEVVLGTPTVPTHKEVATTYEHITPDYSDEPSQEELEVEVRLLEARLLALRSKNKITLA
ncbi:hypothetical protein [Enterovibrio calviensis]|uniref:hypothetical protein n=1 Tax=Enterovibrio calviensis TaxID=91359 RepID=UPI0004895E3A|nr:hypothetical protein [Enterovibrio calviensis]